MRKAQMITYGFKPYYNWNTFNTGSTQYMALKMDRVLNLIITGIPSIRY